MPGAPTTGERELVEAIRRGDEDAFVDLVERYHVDASLGSCLRAVSGCSGRGGSGDTYARPAREAASDGDGAKGAAGRFP